MVFHIWWTTDCLKLIDSSKWPKERILNEYSKICIFLRKPEAPKKCLFSKLSMSRELYIISNWLVFQSDHLSISVYQEMYIKNQRKWVKIQISGAIMGEIYLDIFLNLFFMKFRFWIDKNWLNRKQAIDEICYGLKKSVLTVSMSFLCW